MSGNRLISVETSSWEAPSRSCEQNANTQEFLWSNEMLQTCRRRRSSRSRKRPPPSSPHERCSVAQAEYFEPPFHLSMQPPSYLAKGYDYEQVAHLQPLELWLQVLLHTPAQDRRVCDHELRRPAGGWRQRGAKSPRTRTLAGQRLSVAGLRCPKRHPVMMHRRQVASGQT